MAKDEAARLRRELAKHEKGRGKRYPDHLKRRITEYALAQREAGASYDEIATALGLTFETVRRWCIKPRRSASSSLLVPVEVIAEAAHASIAIVSPSGFRLEGLDAAEAVAALRPGRLEALRRW